MIAISSKIRMPSWDFAGIKASNGRYGIHEYPAMLHYLLVRELLKEFGEGKRVLFDPFCGSGVSLCEGIRAGKKAIGIDINPLALLIAKVRASNLNIHVPIDTLIKEAKTSNPDVLKVKNMEYWFKPQVIESLGKLRKAIRNYIEADFYELLLVAFSQTVRSVSNNRKGEFKRYRMQEQKLKDFNPDVFEIFSRTLLNYIQRLKDDPLPEGSLELYCKDLREGIELKEPVDIVITSPPYGDSKTTVAYEQFSSFSLEWLSGLNPFGDACMGDLRRLSIGGGKKKGIIPQVGYSSSLSEVISGIVKTSIKRAKEVHNFFLDLYTACSKIVDKLNKEAIVCFVVGNRKVANIDIPMDEIVKEIFENLGLTHKQTLVRKIHNKRMPLVNSPTNKVGMKSNTMHYEYIVVMEKV